MAADDWVPLAPASSQQLAAVAVGSTLSGIVLFGGSANLVVGTFIPTWSPARVVVSIALVLAGAALVFAVLRLRSPTLYANLGTGELRVRGRRIPFGEVTRATVRQHGSMRRPVLVLAVGTRDGARGTVLLRDRNGGRLPDRAREVLEQVVAASDIAPPSASYDPTGRFARYNFPDQLSKADALTLIADVPGGVDPVTGLLY